MSLRERIGAQKNEKWGFLEQKSRNEKYGVSEQVEKVKERKKYSIDEIWQPTSQTNMVGLNNKKLDQLKEQINTIGASNNGFFASLGYKKQESGAGGNRALNFGVHNNHRSLSNQEFAFKV